MTKPYIPDVMQGDRPSAAWINQVKEAAVRDQFVPTPLEEYLDLFELIGDPELDSDWNEYIAPAKPVVITAIGGQKRYTRMDDYPTEYVGFISQPRSGEDAPTAPTAKSGDRVFTYTHWGNREVVGTSAPSPVRFFTGTTTSSVSSSDSSFTVSGLAAVDNGSVPEPDSGSNWTVDNDIDLAIGSSKLAYIIQHADGSRVALAAAMISQSVVTAMQVTGATVQVKTRSLVGYWDGAESAWTTIHTGTASCPE